jgi:hypothetical protein
MTRGDLLCLGLWGVFHSFSVVRISSFGVLLFSPLLVTPGCAQCAFIVHSLRDLSLFFVPFLLPAPIPLSSSSC